MNNVTRSICRLALATSLITLSVDGLFAEGAQAAPVNIVALGASNTVGLGVTSADAYPAQIQAMLRAKGIDASVSVVAISGQNSAAQLRDSQSVPAGTTLVTYESLVPNDRKTGIGPQNKANLAQLVAGLRARGIKAVLISIHMPAGDYQPDHEHLTPHGHQALAAQYLPQILAAIHR